MMDGRMEGVGVHFCVIGACVCGFACIMRDVHFSIG